MTQRYRYSASLLSNKDRCKIEIYSRDIVGSFCYSLAKERFCTFDIASQRTKEKRSCRGPWVAPLFLTLTVQKFTAFSAPLLGLEKIGANNAPKNCPLQFFLPIFSKKIISASLKLSAKMVFALRTNQRAICPANRADKKERS